MGLGLQHSPYQTLSQILVQTFWPIFLLSFFSSLFSLFLPCFLAETMKSILKVAPLVRAPANLWRRPHWKPIFCLFKPHLQRKRGSNGWMQVLLVVFASICSSSIQGQFCQNLGRDMGGCKTYGGWKTYQRTRSPENFWTPPKELLVCCVVDFCRRKTEHWHVRGVENVPYEGGPKPLFGRGVIREVFHPPLFSTPPWRPLENIRHSRNASKLRFLGKTPLKVGFTWGQKLFFLNIPGKIPAWSTFLFSEVLQRIRPLWRISSVVIACQWYALILWGVKGWKPFSIEPKRR